MHRRCKRPIGAIAALSVLALALGAGACGGGGKSGAGASKSVTVYSADGLKTALSSGQQSWFDQQFAAFRKQTGISVRYVEGGSGDVLNRVEAEKANTQADVLVTLPPFIQKGAADGVLQKLAVANESAVPAARKDPSGYWTTLVDNYLTFIYNAKQVKAPPRTFADLLAPGLKGKLQYSTPGQAGDGTAFMIAGIHAFGDNTGAAMAYFKRLQANNVGPSSSTGALTTKVVKGELAVANGDLQLNGLIVQQNPQTRLWIPRDATGRPFTFALPYAVGLVRNAPNAANGRKLIDFLLSRRAQSTVSALSNGLPARSDVKPSDRNYKVNQAFLARATVWQPDWPAIQRNLTTLLRQWRDATGG